MFCEGPSIRPLACGRLWQPIYGTSHSRRELDTRFYVSVNLHETKPRVTFHPGHCGYPIEIQPDAMYYELRKCYKPRLYIADMQPMRMLRPKAETNVGMIGA
jgi:hypothetical protein